MLSITRCSGAVRTDTMTASVAAASEATTKKCQGCALSAAGAGGGAAAGVASAASVEVAELIGETLLEGGIDRLGGRRAGQGRLCGV